MTSVAGHVFLFDGCCSCGKRLADISFAAYDPVWVGQGDIAHTSNLTNSEQDEIREAVERIADATLESGKI